MSGSNVIGDLICSYQKITPYEGGHDMVQVSAFDVKGWIPGFVQGVAVSRQADVLKHMVDYLMTGKKPDPIF